MNSLRYKPKNHYYYKKWTPETSVEDRFKRKREREDQYLKNFTPEKRPILVVNKKEVYKGANEDELLKNQKDKDKFFKISENTQEVEDVDREIYYNRDFIKRHTVVHGKQQVEYEDQEDPEAIYKIEGIEYLPKGFLELDPLLYKDEYKFEDSDQEKEFEKEQRKLKAIRRKQYAQKNVKKKRDVTYYVIDEYRQKLLNYLEDWYSKYKRRMNDAELRELARLFKMDKQKVEDLQNAYLEKKRVENTHQLQKHLKNNKRLKKGKIKMEPALTKYFVKVKGNKNKKKKKGRSKTPKQNKYLDMAKNKVHKNRDFYDRVKVADSIKSQKKKEEENNQFNNMINRHKPDDYGFGRNKEVTVNKAIGDEHFVIKEVEPFEEEDRENRRVTDRIKEKIEKEMTTLEKLERSFSSKRSEGLRSRGSRNNSAQRRSKETSPRVLNSRGSKELSPRYSKTKRSMHYSRKNSQSHNSIHNRSRDTILDDKTEIKRVTIVEQGANGMNVVTQKLRPVEVGNDYFHQTIEEVVAPDGQRRVSVITRNQKGDIISSYDLDTFLLGQYYENRICNAERQLDEDSIKYEVTVDVLNDKGETVNKQRLNSTVSKKTNQMTQEVFDEFGVRKSIITTHRESNCTIRKHSLRPTLVGNQYYHQIIKEVYDDYKEPEIKVETVNERGNTVHTQTVAPELIGETYEINIVDDKVDNTGKRKVTYEVVNERGESVMEHKLRPTCYTALGRKYIKDLSDEILEEIVDDDNNRKISLIKKDKGGESIVYTEIRPSRMTDTATKKSVYSQNARVTVVGNDYYENAIEDTMNDVYQKKVSKAVLNEEPDIKVQYKDIADDCYIDLIGNAIKDYDEEDEEDVNIRLVEDGDNVYTEIVKLEPEDRVITRKNTAVSRKETVRSKKSRKETGHSKNSKAVKVTIIGDDYYGQIVDTMVDHETNRKATANSLFMPRPSKLLNEYFNELLKETDTHRKTLLLAKEYKDNNEEDKIIDEVITSERRETKQSKLESFKEYAEEVLNLPSFNQEQVEINQTAPVDEPRARQQTRNSLYERLGDDVLNEKLNEMFEKEKGNLTPDIVRRLTEAKPGESKDKIIMEAFKEFSKNAMPESQHYKESILFVTLFYYYLRKNGRLNI